MSNKGKVYLIGAGPGDPGLITVKGNKLLQDCDVVVYDNLIPDELIITLPQRIDKIYVGKKAGKHTVPQDKINELLVDLAAQGKRVVRLKGSDPLIFGRGGEEAAFLKKHDIAFEIVPGITAGISVPTYAGIPGTDREKASTVVFVTGHKAGDKSVSSVDWSWLAGMKNGTIVIYMGVGEIENIVKKLIDGGMNPKRPATVIERGTYPTQRVYESALGKLPETVTHHEIKPPSIIVIGEVVELRPLLKWFEDRPLFGRRIMVTRPADQAGNMYKTLRELGAEVLPYPTIATETVNDETGWKEFKDLQSNIKWLLFTSENGVRYFFDQLLKRFDDIRIVHGYKLAAVGFGTARALRQFNIKPDFIPQTATTQALADELVAAHAMRDAVVIRIRGNLSDDRVENRLTEAGAGIIPLHTYRTIHPEWPPEFEEKLLSFPPDMITFTSGSTVAGLWTRLGDEKANRLLENAGAASIGPMTSERLKARGINVAVEATEYSVPGLIRAIEQYYRQGEED